MVVFYMVYVLTKEQEDDHQAELWLDEQNAWLTYYLFKESTSLKELIMYSIDTSTMKMGILGHTSWDEKGVMVSNEDKPKRVQHEQPQEPTV